MKNYLLCLLMIVSYNLTAQNYIGVHKDSLIFMLKKYENNFRLDNTTTNTAYKYNKYVDRINEQTWLFFLDEKDICTYHKLMSDYLNYEEIKGKLNEKYTNTGDKTWEYKEHNKTYSVKLIEEEWYFTVITKEKVE